ncbi:MAG: oxidoreductase [Hydrogenophaga sp.]|uniref:PDR/VanB family oxidoreductase n=1 Tax=Hydrogenophaga sp. TaxID=1904254 RepID=UPI002629B25E|nr:PDR/VanB family oxidoreductase [Hydrogenophaga sp.]MCW5669106.1 oxidoreductase [Hydrogenophaga sp.]
MTAPIQARVAQRRWATPSVLELVLDAGETALPEAAPGAHIDVTLGDGTVRQYSLVDPAPEGGHRYRIGVKVLPDGRGGSRRLAEELALDSPVRLGGPRNLFALDSPGSRPIVLVAGGIGITPIHAMATRLRRTPGAQWTLHYTFSRREEAYFPSPWLLDDARVCLYESLAEGQGRRLDLAALVQAAEASGGADIYCCGPTALMDALARLCEGRPSLRCVQESFEAPDLSPDGSETAFDVQLSRSGRTLRVAADRSILETLREAGVDVPFSCEQGICGACETRVLAGTPVHRDAILSPGEQAAGRSMMICCSRAATPSLTLDL